MGGPSGDLDMGAPMGYLRAASAHILLGVGFTSPNVAEGHAHERAQGPTHVARVC